MPSAVSAAAGSEACFTAPDAVRAIQPVSTLTWSGPLAAEPVKSIPSRSRFEGNRTRPARRTEPEAERRRFIRRSTSNGETTMAHNKLNEDDDNFLQVPQDATLIFAGLGGTETWIER